MVQSTNMDVLMCWLDSILKHLFPEIRIEMWHDLVMAPNVGQQAIEIDDPVLWRINSPTCGQRVRSNAYIHGSGCQNNMFFQDKNLWLHSAECCGEEHSDV